VTTGEREIDPEQAAVVGRIYRDFVAGMSPEAIVKALNREGVAGPFGGSWSPSTIHGNAKRGTGILNNELYVGRMVWNRLRYGRDPDTGKRVSRLNPANEWISKSVPVLRIINNELWDAAKERQKATRRAVADGGNIGRARRPQYLFSGLTKCGVCGSGFIMASANRLSCFGARYKGICDNRLTVRRDDVEARVLKALQENLLNQDLFEQFCEEFTREMNRLRMEQRAGQSSAKRELARPEVRRKKLVESIMAASEVKDEIIAIANRRGELETQLKAATEPPPILHPMMADLYRANVENLASALQREDTRLEASEMLRGLIESIVLIPDEGQLRVELRGNLAAMLTAAQQTKRSPETGDLLVPVQLVAGAGFEPATFGL
jgi:site-specific DNA recombinase